MHRRSFLKGAGIVTILVAGGAVWRAEDQGVFSVGQGPAYQPWRDWQTDASAGPLALVRAGILAASPHNTQPWLFRVGAARVALLADTARHLGSFDPYLREMHIGLGCAIENMTRAARAYGYEATVMLRAGTLAGPAAPPRPEPVAVLELAPARPRPDALFDAIGRRHTDRTAYAVGRPVPSDALEAMWETFKEDPEVRLFLYSATEERRQFGAAVVA